MQTPPLPSIPTNIKDLEEYMRSHAKPDIPPFDRLPCANTEKTEDKACSRSGTRLCSNCRLVGYCSRECQTEHWKAHKADCKHPMRSSAWQPAYIRENRTPNFLSNDNTTMVDDEYTQGMSLWGDMPAHDILKITQNEKNAVRDYKIAFAKSGDLASVISTVCSLPNDYSGKLTILVNDESPLVTARNIMILLIFGVIPDMNLAVDIALHFWYSVAFPIEYRFRLQGVVTSLLSHIANHDDDPRANFPLGPRSNAGFLLHPLLAKMLIYFTASSIPFLDGLVNYIEHRATASREDYRDRMYSGMKPSHRLAFLHYRNDGLLLPFGAPSEQFVSVNSSLFSPDGTWLQTDIVDPLNGYPLDAVIAAGRAHGTPVEDIYGCLYFYVSDQLHRFARCLKNFDITFRIFDDEVADLPKMIRMGQLARLGVPSSTRFDRIDVSNTLDANRHGIEAVLKVWGPLLSSQSKATLLGFFTDWTQSGQPNGNVVNTEKATQDRLMNRLQREGKLPPVDEMNSEERRIAMMAFIYRSPPLMQSIYDNSLPFEEFLKKQSLPATLRRVGLTRKQQHTITPYRLLSPPNGSAASLPDFSDDSWYYEHQLASHTWVERFIEFTAI